MGHVESIKRVRPEVDVGIRLEAEREFDIILRNFHKFCKQRELVDATEFFVDVEQHGNLPATKWKIFLTWTERGIEGNHSLINKNTIKGPIYSEIRFQVGPFIYTSDFKQMTREDKSVCFIYPHEVQYHRQYPVDENGSLKIQCKLMLYSHISGKRLRSLGKEQDEVTGPVLKRQRMDMLQLFAGAQAGTYNSDVTIITSDGKEIKALKAILGARCEVFKAMFATDMLEANTGVVNLPDLSFPAALTLVKYLYTGDVVQSFAQGNEEAQVVPNFTLEKREGAENYFIEGTEIDVAEIVDAAKQYDLAELLTCLDAKLAASCNLTSAVYLFRLASKFSLEKTSAAAEKILLTRPDLVLEALRDQNLD